jgi:hypothetical protein
MNVHSASHNEIFAGILDRKLNKSDTSRKQKTTGVSVFVRHVFGLPKHPSIDRKGVIV